MFRLPEYTFKFFICSGFSPFTLPCIFMKHYHVLSAPRDSRTSVIPTIQCVRVSSGGHIASCGTAVKNCFDKLT